MRVYLDNCCYNRPFDDQHNLATALESFAKLQIQSMMRSGELEYVWSDSLCHEVDKNPFPPIGFSRRTRAFLKRSGK